MAGEKNKLGGQFVLGVLASLVAAAIWLVLASFVGVLNDQRYLPLWGFLTIFTVLIVGCAWVVYLATRSLRERLADQAAVEAEWEAVLQERDNNLGEQLQHWAQAEEEFKTQIERLNKALYESGLVIYEDGLYYPKTDTEHKQPLCRVCWEGNHKRTTVVRFWQDTDGEQMFYCPACEVSHPLPSSPSVDDDDE